MKVRLAIYIARLLDWWDDLKCELGFHEWGMAYDFKGRCYHVCQHCGKIDEL